MNRIIALFIVLFLVPFAAQAGTLKAIATPTSITATGLASGTVVTLGAGSTGITQPSSKFDSGLATQGYADYAADDTVFGRYPLFTVRLTTGNSNLAGTYANGTAGVGATLTEIGNGALTIDSVSVALNDRVFLANQTSRITSGIYTETQAGDGSHPWILTRATDFDTPAEMNGNINGVGNNYITATAGTSNAKYIWWFDRLITTIGTDTPIGFSSLNKNGAIMRDSYNSPNNHTSGQMYVADANAVMQAVTMSGDVTLSNAGAATVAKINGVTLGTTTATSGNLLIGSGSAWVTNAMSGDCTISSAGAINCTTQDGAIPATKGAVRIATTAAFSSVSYVAGVLTNTGTLAAFSVDGVSGSSGDRVLVKNQASQLQNGCYNVTTVGSGAIAWVLTRCTDYDTTAEIKEGDTFFVEEGTANAETGWVMTTSGSIIVGTTAIAFSQAIAGSYIADAASDTTTWPVIAGSQTGSQNLLTDGGLTYNSSSDTLTSTNLAGAGAAITALSASNINAGTLGTAYYTQTYCWAASDQTTTIVAANNLVVQYPFDATFTITGVHADVGTAPTGLMTIDINETGTTIFSTLLTIDANEFTSGTAATPAVISDSSFAANAQLSIDVDSTTGGKALEVCVTGHY